MELDMIKQNGIISFIGDIEYTERQFKTIDIDGEIYHNEKYIKVKKNVNDLDSVYFADIEFKLPILNIDLKFKDFFGFYNQSLSHKIYNLSTNTDVNLILTAFRKKLLDKRIKHIGTRKQDTFFEYNYPHFKNTKREREFVEEIIENKKIDIPFFWYGFNNVVYFSISLNDLIKINYDDMPKNLLDILNRYNILPKKYDEVEASINILKKYIKTKQNKLCNQ